MFEDVYNNYRLYATCMLIALTIVVALGVKIANIFSIVALLAVTIAVLSIFVGFFTNFNGNGDHLVCIIGERLVKKVQNCSSSSQELRKLFCDELSCDPYYEAHKHFTTQRMAIPGLGSGQIFAAIYNIYGQNDDAPTTSSEGWIIGDSTKHLFVLFGIFFPSVTGIMAGANRSGDLRNPQRSIPTGTIGAFLTVSCIYLCLVIFYIGSIDRLVLLDKFGHSLSDNGGMIASFIAWPHRKVVEIGALLSTTGAALQVLIGAPRLLQAIAFDRPLPFMQPLSVSWRGEPIRALLVTAVISCGAIMVGNLDKIAPLLTMFFLLFYAAINLACAKMGASDNPEWRPSFKCYHWSVSFVGTIHCIVLMFSIDAIYASLAIAIFFSAYLGIKDYRGYKELHKDDYTDMHDS